MTAELVERLKRKFIVGPGYIAPRAVSTEQIENEAITLAKISKGTGMMIVKSELLPTYFEVSIPRVIVSDGTASSETTSTTHVPLKTYTFLPIIPPQGRNARIVIRLTHKIRIHAVTDGPVGYGYVRMNVNDGAFFSGETSYYASFSGYVACSSSTSGDLTLTAELPEGLIPFKIVLEGRVVQAVPTVSMRIEPTILIEQTHFRYYHIGVEI